MDRDLFWPVFLSTLAIVLAIGLGAAYVRGWQFGAPDTAPDTATPKDPFAAVALSKAPFEGFFYRESLPYGFEDRSWSSKTNWRVADGNTGNFVAQVTVFTEYGGVEIGSPTVPAGVYHTLTFTYREDAAVRDTMIQLYDPHGLLLGEQPILWYSVGTRRAGGWVEVSVPLKNLGAEGKSIGSISFSSATPGVFSLDDIKLNSSMTEHAVYVPPITGAVDPFLGVQTKALPYVSDLGPAETSAWYVYRGRFVFSKTNVLYVSDDLSTSTSDGLMVHRAGLVWQNYRFDTTMRWGTGVSYALLLRFIDDANYTSCSFSINATGVQIFNIVRGKSEMVAYTPDLPFHTGDEVMQLSASVIGNKVSCYINGERVLSGEVAKIAPHGTAGIESWDPVSGAYPHVISKLSVVAE